MSEQTINEYKFIEGTEQWRTLSWFDGRYRVSDHGNVLNVRTNRLVQMCQNKQNEWSMLLGTDKEKRMKPLLKKLVYENFVRKLTNRTEFITHIDGNKNNNKLSNLHVGRSNVPTIKTPPQSDDNEEWRDIKGYEKKYMVSNYGRVFSHFLGNLLSFRTLSSDGYYTVSLNDADAKQKQWTIHKLVVLTFVGTVEKGKVIDHINRNKLDNRLSNLRIVTIRENNNNRDNTCIAAAEGIVVQQFDLEGNFIREYKSINVATIALGAGHKNICDRIEKGRFKKDNYVLKYKHDKVTNLDEFVRMGTVRGVDLSNYSINKKGVVYSHLKKVVLKSNVMGGYSSIPLNGSSFRINRLVAITFKPLKEGDVDTMVVNHKDENRLNNDLENLEWVTQQENISHSIGRAVRQIDPITNKCIKVFNCLRAAGREIAKANPTSTPINIGSAIGKVCRGTTYEKAYGYKWEFVKDNESQPVDKHMQLSIDTFKPHLVERSIRQLTQTIHQDRTTVATLLHDIMTPRNSTVVPSQ